MLPSTGCGALQVHRQQLDIPLERDVRPLQLQPLVIIIIIIIIIIITIVMVIVNIKENVSFKMDKDKGQVLRL